MILFAMIFPAVIAWTAGASEGAMNGIGQKSDLEMAVNVLETYIRLRDGIRPSPFVDIQRRHLRHYLTALGNAREANKAIAFRADEKCRRFINLYNEVGNQLANSYTWYLSERRPSEDVQQLLSARIQILQFFEAALFGLVIARAEAGSSELDIVARSTCTTTDRTAWTSLLLKSHQALTALRLDVFGEPSAAADSPMLQRIRRIDERYSRNSIYKQVGFLIGEIAVSIVLWDKYVAPTLHVLAQAASATAIGKLINVGGGVAYLIGWVAFDRWARNTFDFLAPDPDILNRRTLSSWQQIMELGEEFTASDLASPALYKAYLELFTSLQKQRILEFLNENEELLTSAEQEFGSVDQALKTLKEELKNENALKTRGTRVLP